MSNKIQNPANLFYDIDGRPLDAGYIFIGESGKNPEIYPVPVFWDEGLTVPAQQPIRTRNGFFSKNGSFGKIYTENAKCSITIKNKKKSIVLVDLFSEVYFSNKADSIFDESGKSQQEINNNNNTKISSLFIKTTGTRNILEFIPSDKHKYLLDFTLSKYNLPDLHGIIQEAFDTIEIENNDIVFPFGYYFTGKTLFLPKKSRVIGYSNPYILTTDNFSDLSVLSCDKANQPEYYLDGFQINGNSSAYLEGLRIGGCRNSVFKNITVTSCWGAGVKIYPTNSDSGDVENFELDHIWTVLSGGIKIQTNSDISRGNITDGTITNCQLTTGDKDQNTGYPLYLSASQDKMIFGLKVDRIFTQATSNNHIVINPNSGNIYSNTFSNFSGETWKQGVAGPSIGVNKECLYVFDGDFTDNAFNEFYRVGMQADGIKLGIGSSGNKFDGLTFVDFNVAGYNNKWLRFPVGASHNSFKNVNLRDALNVNSTTNAIAANTIFSGVDGKIYDLDGSNTFECAQVSNVAPTLIKRSYIFELNSTATQLKNYPVLGCAFTPAGSDIAITVPAGSTPYYLEIPFNVTAKFKGTKVSAMFNYTCGSSMNGMSMSMHLCGVGRGITDYTSNKSNTMAFYADYVSTNKKLVITFSGTRTVDTSVTLNDIVICEGSTIPYLYNYQKNYIEN